MNKQDQFDKNFLKHYQFWILVTSALSIAAVAYLSVQSYKVQLILKSIEETRQREKFSSDLEIIFSSNVLKGCDPEKATYDLKFINKSSHNFKDFETIVSVCYENPETRVPMESEVFTFPRKDLFPSDLPVRFMENGELTRLFCFNIMEARKTIPKVYKLKSFEFFLKWSVDMGDENCLLIKKRKSFSIER